MCMVVLRLCAERCRISQSVDLLANPFPPHHEAMDLERSNMEVSGIEIYTKQHSAMSSTREVIALLHHGAE